MKIRTLLDELDGRNCRNRFGRNNGVFALLGRSIEDILIPLRPSRAQTLRDSLTALGFRISIVTVYSRFAEKSLEQS